MTAQLPAGVTFAQEKLPCVCGCGLAVTVRVHGRPGLAMHLLERPAPDPQDALVHRFLDDLREPHLWPSRTRGRDRSAEPYWYPPETDVTDLVRTSGWTWSRPGGGPVAVLDRSGAWPSAASSVSVAHGRLHRAPTPDRFTGYPGFYKVIVYRWSETHVPHPLGPAARGDAAAVWVPHPRAQLLQRLADAGRYPEGFIDDAWISTEPARLDRWATHINRARIAALQQYGRGSEQYELGVKARMSQAVTLIIGTKRPGQPRTYVPGVPHRPDWGLAIQDQASVSLWSWADDCYQVVRDAGRPELGPVGMRNVDELLIPQEAVPLVTTLPRAGGRPPLKIDPDGLKLGTFKIKELEQ